MRPNNQRFYWLFVFLATNAVVVFCENWIISHPSSNIICIPGSTSYNMSLVGGINSGVFTAIDKTNSMAACTRKACEEKKGDLALLIENNCFLVICFTKEYCKTRKIEESPNMLSVAVTPYRWFDAAPVFLNLTKRVKAHENLKGRGSLLVIRAQAESRRSKNASVNLFITGGNTDNAFRLDQQDAVSARLVVAKSLDREKNSLYNLEITAVNVEESKRSKERVVVEVLDSNDNPPRFPKENYTTIIMSNISIGSQIFQVKAVDDDPIDSQQLLYYLVNHKHVFQILPESGKVLIRNKIRVDRLRKFNLIVVAFDGIHRAVKSLTIKVIPVNEYRPYFERIEYRVKVSEAVSVGTSVMKLSARDNDYGDLGALNFSIVSGNSLSYFTIDSTGEIRTTKLFLTSRTRNFTLGIKVRDRGSPPRYSLENAIVRISIENLQNHRVKFDLPVYHVTLLENTPVGSRILTVRAMSGVGKRKLDTAKKERMMRKRSKKIFYSISQQDGNEAFRVGRHSGDVKTIKQLDFEKRKRFRLVISARDVEKKGKGRKTEKDSTVVIIRVLDVNDNRPVFNPAEYQEIIDEDTAVGTSVLKVNTTDADSSTNSKVKFSITGGNINSTFSITNTGLLTLKNSLKGQKVALYNLSITAVDFGSPPLQSSEPAFVYIKIRNRGDGSPTKRPEFQVVIYKAEVPEDAPIGTTILQVRANNNVDGGGESMNYWLTALGSREVQKFFAIDPDTGVIRTIALLDYETTSLYVFYVAATVVKGVSSIDTVMVKIVVKDVNDNRPEWISYKPKVALIGRKPIGSILTSIKASDMDGGENSKLRYSVVSGNKGQFLSLDEKTGDVAILHSLEKQNLRLITLRASVIDSGNPPLAAIRKAQLSVMVVCEYVAPLILIQSTESTMKVQFHLKNLDTSNVASYGIIVQEHSSTDEFFNEYTAKEPITWYQVNHVTRQGHKLYRYIAKIINSTDRIMRQNYVELEVGTEKDCEKRKDYCNGPLKASIKYRFQLRAYIKNKGPFSQFVYKDSQFSDPQFTAHPEAAATYKKEGKRDYDGVVYSVAVALVLIILLAFLRGFFRLKRDKKRIHEEKKRRISFPVSNPKFDDPESPLDKIHTAGPPRKILTPNSTVADKGSEYARSDEDEGSSPDSALDDCLRDVGREVKPVNLQEQRLKNYFNSVDSSNCHSCDHVKIYCVQQGSSNA